MSMNGNKFKGIVGTIVFHLVAILLLVMFGFTTPLPLPAEQGILINFGTSDEGSGALEPKVEEKVNPASSTQNAEVNKEEAPITQDYEEAPTLPVKKTEPKNEKKVKKVEPKAKENTPKNTNTDTNNETEKPREVNKKALFPGQKVNGSNTGEGDTGNPGNQGGVEGSPDSPNRTGSDGGGGNQQGGIIANLNGRTVQNLPKPDYPSMKEGRVVVQVTVDNQGKVTKAISGIKGSTTLDAELLKAAEKAALNARFNIVKNVNTPAYQIGTITYIFKLQ
ncbi:MAG TPA: TonB family protein [Tenuifilaceae bacterium]|nr:TonB family protein [Tenuifilaceae bacterium]